MPIGPNIAIIGAGNRAAAIPVLSTIFNLPPDMGDRITLCDSHAEMLDLFARVARGFAAYNGTPGISIATAQDPKEAMQDADAVFICIGILDQVEELHYRIAALPPHMRIQVEPVVRIELLRNQLSAISCLLNRDDKQLVFNLVANTQLSGTLIDSPAFHIDWPAAVPEESQYTFAHRALRLIRGDDPIFEPLQEYKDNPLATAIMDSRPAPENRYAPEVLMQISHDLLGR